MAQYVVSASRKKRDNETLNQFYATITLGVVEAPSLAKAEQTAWAQYGYRVTVQAVKKAPFYQHPFIAAIQKKAEATR